MGTCTEERFLKDVAKHGMTVLRDDGVNRHVRFTKPDSGVYWFEILTWPGCLCIHGDCGTFVFTRLADMFEFFRAGLRDGEPGKLFINPSYWSEKIVADDPADGFRVWSPEGFNEAVRADFESWCGDDTDQQARNELWAALQEEVLPHAENEYEAFTAVSSFKHKGFRFDCFHEHSLKVYTYRFIWNLYAIAWGIGQYDKSKVKA